MADYRTLFDEHWIKAWDLGGKPWTGTITKVEQGLLENARAKKKDRKPVVWFKGWSKPLALNKTNAKTIASMYGNEVNAWVGKKVTLYPTTTSFGNETGIDCIRIKPGVPSAKADQPVPNVPPPMDDTSAPAETERCETGTCGRCAMCIDAQAKELSS